MGGKQANKIFKTLKFGVIKVPDPNNAAQTIDKAENSQKNTDYDTVVNKDTQYFVPKRNIIHERCLFGEKVQKQGETVEEFVRQLQADVSKCDFADPDSMVRDRFVIGLKDTTLKKKLQLIPDLTLEKAVVLARQEELVKLQLQQQAHSHVAEDVSEVKAKFKAKSSKVKPETSADKGKKLPKKCSKCGYEYHQKGNKCPAQGQTCRKNHFASVCRSPRKRVDEVRLPEEDSGGDFFLGTVECGVELNSQPWYVSLNVCQSTLEFKIDTGADVSVISEDTWKLLKDCPKLKSSKVTLHSPGGELESCGHFVAKTTYKDVEYQFDVWVVKSPKTTNLLAGNVAQTMGLVEGPRVSEVSKESKGIGLLKTSPVKIKLKDNAKPYCVTSSRKVPFPLMDSVKKELQRMLDCGVIRKVTEPTEWCAPMVPVVKRNGKIRICVDLRQLNKAVLRENYTLPNLSDISPKLAEAKVFSTLDAESGFWQIPLEPSSQLFTTFMTPFGRFAFCRVPFGITSAPEIFHLTLGISMQIILFALSCDIINKNTEIH